MSATSLLWLRENSTDNHLLTFLDSVLDDITTQNPSSVLFVPPDYTRVNSQTGFITAYLYHKLPASIKKAILPAVGLHHSMSNEQKQKMFGTSAMDMLFYEHDAYGRKKQYPNHELVKLAFTNMASDIIAPIQNMDELGEAWKSISIAVNQKVMDFELVVSLGQVVPHEVLGFSNFHKNILIGLGGEDFINKSHFLSAAMGIGNLLARANNPMRDFLAEVYDKYLAPQANIYFLFTVTGKEDSELNPANGVVPTSEQKRLMSMLPPLPPLPQNLSGVFWGKDKKTFLTACTLSEKENISSIPKPINEVFVYMPKDKYQSLWLTNKAIYRTLGILKAGGILYIDAPGLVAYGESQSMNTLIAKYGYMDLAGVKSIFQQEHAIADSQEEEVKLADNLAVAAHLIHGYQNNHRVVFVNYSDVGSEKCLGGKDYEQVGFESIPFNDYMTKLDSLFENRAGTSGDIIHSVQNRVLTYGNKDYYFIYDAGLGFWKC